MRRNAHTSNTAMSGGNWQTLGPPSFAEGMIDLLDRADLADIVPARGSLCRIQFSTQPNLSGGVRHRASASGKRDQRGKASPARWKVDRAGIGAKELITAL